MLLGYAGRNVVPRLLMNSLEPELAHVDFDWSVLLFTLTISLATAVTLLVAIAAVFLVATSPNWLGR